MKLLWILFMNCIFAGIAILTKQYLIEYFDNVSLLIFIFFIESSLFIFYMWLLYKKDTQWVIELKKRTFRDDVLLTSSRIRQQHQGSIPSIFFPTYPSFDPLSILPASEERHLFDKSS